MHNFPKHGDTVLLTTCFPNFQNQSEVVGIRISKQHRTAGPNNVFVGAFKTGHDRIMFSSIENFCQCRMVLVEKRPLKKHHYHNEIIEY